MKAKEKKPRDKIIIGINHVSKTSAGKEISNTIINEFLCHSRLNSLDMIHGLDIRPFYKSNYLDIVGYLVDSTLNDKDICGIELILPKASNSLDHYIRYVKDLFNPITLKIFCWQLAYQIEYFKRNKIVHCDIKPENILVFQETYSMTICDFGLSEFNMHSPKFRRVGTPVFMSPEILSTGTTFFPCDVWALGCVFVEIFHTFASSNMPVRLFHPLDGKVPSISKEIQKYFSPEEPVGFKILDTFPEQFASQMSNFQDLVNRMFTWDMNTRITPSEILEHEFFSDIISPPITIRPFKRVIYNNQQWNHIMNRHNAVLSQLSLEQLYYIACIYFCTKKKIGNIVRFVMKITRDERGTSNSILDDYEILNAINYDMSHTLYTIVYEHLHNTRDYDREEEWKHFLYLILEQNIEFLNFSSNSILKHAVRLFNRSPNVSREFLKMSCFKESSEYSIRKNLFILDINNFAKKIFDSDACTVV